MTIFDRHYSQIAAEAMDAHPNEAVWLVTQEACQRLTNLAEDPTVTFQVDPSPVLELRMAGIEFGIVHSHPMTAAVPSAHDMQQQMAGGEPWAIIATDGQSCSPFTVWGGGRTQPLWQRHFVHGITDCYAFLRDRYAEEGVTLPDFPRDWLWWHRGGDLYADNFTAAGFERVYDGDIRVGDMITFKVSSDVVNHAAYYEGNEVISHHSGSRIPIDHRNAPRLESLPRWHDYIDGVYRHKEFGE